MVKFLILFLFYLINLLNVSLSDVHCTETLVSIAFVTDVINVRIMLNRGIHVCILKELCI